MTALLEAGFSSGRMTSRRSAQLASGDHDEVVVVEVEGLVDDGKQLLARGNRAKFRWRSGAEMRGPHGSTVSTILRRRR
jgi:hypothetical protein